MNPVRGLGEASVVTAWFKNLCEQPQLESFNFDKASQFAHKMAASLSSASVPRVLPRIFSNEEAPDYFKSLPGWAWAVMPDEKFLLVARDLYLLSALVLIQSLDNDRMYAVVQEEMTGLYQIVRGLSNGVVALDPIILQTHREWVALPSNLTQFEIQSGCFQQPWSYIYSCPPNERQLSYILRRRPHVYEITLWRDRFDPERGSRITTDRTFLVRAVTEPGSGDDGEIIGLKVRELYHEGSVTQIGQREWQFNAETYPDLDVQKFWKDVIDSSAS